MDNSSRRTTVTKLTPDGRAAVATIAVSGPQAIENVARCFHSASGQRVEHLAIDKISFGRWFRDEDTAEDVVIARRSAAEFEVNCHGGAAAAKAIIQSLVAQGAIETASQHWIDNRAPGQLEAAAWHALADAKTDRTAAILLDQYRGSLRRAIRELIKLAQKGDVATAQTRLAQLIEVAPLGLHLTKPWRITLVGEPNVGKSSLVNRLLGYERSIVFDQPGTTRDVLNASTAFDGWPVELQDTAGLRASQDRIEREGVRRTTEAAAIAHLTLIVFDAQAGVGQLDASLTSNNSPAVAVVNKQDLADCSPWPNHVVRTSAKIGTGVEQLIRAIVARLVPAVPAAGDPVPFLEDHASRCRIAKDHLVRGNVASFQSALAELLD